MRRHEILRYPIEPITIHPDYDTNDLVSAMSYLGFEGRRLGEAVDIWSRMLKKNRTVIWMALSGAMVPAGMREVISYLIRRRMIDVLVTTGATLYHDCYEVLMGRHFLGSDFVDDLMLRKHHIDRVYDLYADESKFYRMDNIIDKQFCQQLKDDFPYSSRSVIHEFGKWLSGKIKDKDSLSVRAYLVGVPVFVPAFSDSGLGFSLMFANRRGRRIIVDGLADSEEAFSITERNRAGVVIVGGGAPMNFIQTVSRRGPRSKSNGFSIMFTTRSLGQDDSMASKSTLSLTRIRSGVTSCHVDATIALPIAAQALSQRFTNLTREVPVFDFSGTSAVSRFERVKL